jgi:type IV pilus assembly protein PilC
MPVFSYIARDQTGAPTHGEVTAASSADAVRQIRAEGKFIIKIEPGGGKGSPKAKTTPAPAAPKGGVKDKPTNPPKKNIFGEKYKPDDLIYFTNQLAVMVETGVSLSDALDACVHEGNSPRFARALDGIIDSVRGGSEFSAALMEHPKVFSPLYSSLIKASEASGMMAPMLRRMGVYLEAQRDMRRKIKGAVTYPIVMFTFAIGVTIFMMTFVLPKFTAIYAGREDKIPIITRALLKFSDYLSAYGLYALGVLIAAAIASFFYFRRPKGRLVLESIKLGMPLMGKLFHKTYLTRSLRTLGTMIQSGVSMLDSIRLTAGVCGSPHYERMWNAVHDRLEGGQQISEALAEHKQIPRAINKMLGAGERGGQLGIVMERVANFCDGELNVAIKTMTALLEPAIVMFLGVVVGGLVLALLLPIFTISKALH